MLLVAVFYYLNRIVEEINVVDQKKNEIDMQKEAYIRNESQPKYQTTCM